MSEMDEQRMQFQWQPAIRVRLVSPNGHEYDFPDWGQWVRNHATFAEFQQICRRNYMTANQCQRFWRWMGRHEHPPSRLYVYVNAEDVKRLFPAPAAGGKPRP